MAQFETFVEYKPDFRKKDRKRLEPIREARGASQPYEEGTATNPRLKALILDVVENQIRAGDPPETRQTFERLLAAGYSRKQAMEMIGSALVEEIWVCCTTTSRLTGGVLGAA